MKPFSFENIFGKEDPVHQGTLRESDRVRAREEIRKHTEQREVDKEKPFGVWIIHNNIRRPSLEERKEEERAWYREGSFKESSRDGVRPLRVQELPTHEWYEMLESIRYRKTCLAGFLDMVIVYRDDTNPFDLSMPMTELASEWRSLREEHTKRDLAPITLVREAIQNRAKQIFWSEFAEDARMGTTGLIRVKNRTLQEYRSALERSLQPILVSVSRDPAFQGIALAAGANLIVNEINPEHIRNLVALADRMKNSPASLTRERLERQKGKFYREAEDEIEERSALTADTEQELAIIEKILRGVEARDILDVGCGFGRISVPLTARGYQVTGLEGNQKLLKRAQEQSFSQGTSAQFIQGNIIEYKHAVPAEAYDAVTYTWHTILEAYGMGNTLETLTSAWRALRPGGTLVFDQPSRENPGMEDGQYGDPEHSGYGAAYLMDQDELRFVLRMAGFEDVEIIPWTTKPTELYQEGMKKWTVTAKKMKGK